MMALEEAFQTTLDETALAGPRTIGEIEALKSRRYPASRGSGAALATAHGPKRERTLAPAAPATPASPIAFPVLEPLVARLVPPAISLPTWILPLGHIFMKLEVEGLEHLARSKGR